MREKRREGEKAGARGNENMRGRKNVGSIFSAQIRAEGKKEKEEAVECYENFLPAVESSNSAALFG